MLDIADTLEIHALLSLYVHVVDGRRWSDLDRVFTEDLIFDATAHGPKIVNGLAELRRKWERTPPPSYHHTLNIVIGPVDQNAARVQSKSIGISPEGRTGSGIYRDLVVRTPQGWRIKERVSVPSARAPELPWP